MAVPERHHRPECVPVLSYKPDRPLALRLYSCPHLVALVRLFGDRELPSEDAKRELSLLYEQFGKERVLAACEELLDNRSAGKTVVFRLKSDVRQLAVQILGPVPSSVPASSSAPATRLAQQSPVTPHPIAEPSLPEPLTESEAPKDAPQPLEHPTEHDVENADAPQQGIENFETFLIHFWLTGSEELCEYCMGLVEQVREDAPLFPEVTEQGWSVEEVAAHYVAKDLRAFVEQEALASRADQMHADLTRQMLDRVDWHELAESFLSDE